MMRAFPGDHLDGDRETVRSLAMRLTKNVWLADGT
jgi:hypothetical protein